MGSPAVLVAVEAGKQHVLICVHLTKTQCFMGVVTDHIVAVDQILSLWVPILRDNSGGEGLGEGRVDEEEDKEEHDVSKGACD